MVALKSVSLEGYDAILNEVVGPGLMAVNTCVDMMGVSIIRATAGALPIVGDEGQHGRMTYTYTTITTKRL